MLCGPNTAGQPMRAVITINAHDAKASFAPVNFIHAAFHMNTLQCVVSEKKYPKFTKNCRKLASKSSGIKPAISSPYPRPCISYRGGAFPPYYAFYSGATAIL